MRLIVRVAGWVGMGASTLLLIGTVMVWVRSVGHKDSWIYNGFAADSKRSEKAEVAFGTARIAWLVGCRGRLWVGYRTDTPSFESQFGSCHFRELITERDADGIFESVRGGISWSGPTCARRPRTTTQHFRFAGFGFHHERAAADSERFDFSGTALVLPVRLEELALVIPMWMPAVLFAIWPGVFAARRLIGWRRRRRRIREGLCLNCGYDLRATPDAEGPRLARCPECGREVEGAAK